MIKPIQTRYNGYHFRSRLEARWAVFFDALGIDYEYEPEGFDLGDGVCYLPDFWLPTFSHSGMYCEVKPTGSDFPKATRLAQVSEQWVWLCAGPPNFAIYKILRLSFTKPQEMLVDCGIPNYGSARDQNRMFSMPCSDACTGKDCNDYHPVVLPLDSFSDYYQRAVFAARSARFEHGESPQPPPPTGRD